MCLRRRTRDPYFACTKVFDHPRPGPESAGHGTPVVRSRSATPRAWSCVNHVPFHAHELPGTQWVFVIVPSELRSTDFFLALLYIHRCFFAHAISSNPLDPIKSQYAPSFLAGYRSACTIIGSVKQQFTMFPEQIARFWVLWTHAFSATVSGSLFFYHHA